jgi:acetaldehyde dehydrogenase (acetylating)
VLCSTENSAVVDEPIAEEVKREFQAQGAYFLNTAEIDAVARVLVTPQRLPNPAWSGRRRSSSLKRAGSPSGGHAYPGRAADGGRPRLPAFDREALPGALLLCRQGLAEGCERCKQILRYGGMGHTMSIHSQNDQIILEFGLHKPAFRIVVNSPTTHGSVGLSTGLDPAMTLGCGGYGGNITSDNISPRHLLNIKRVAYELTPIVSRWDRAAGAGAGLGAAVLTDGRARSSDLPKGPARAPAPTGIAADALSRRIDDFLGSRGFKSETTASISSGGQVRPRSTSDAKPLEFVCEEDVRLAIQAGRKLLVSERAIVTPAARDLGDANRVFSIRTWTA